MIETSAAFAALLDTNPLCLHLTLPDGTEVGTAKYSVLGTEHETALTLANTALLLTPPAKKPIKSAEWSGGSNAGDDITLGSTVAQQLKVELDREALAGLTLTDQMLTATLTIDGADDVIPVAEVKVTKEDSDDDTVTITACDAMVWAFDVQYALDDTALGFDWSTGVDGETLLRTICDTCGVPLATTGLPRVTLTLVDASGYTYREVIAFLACLWGRFARIDGQGRLVLQWYTEVDRQIGPDRYYEGELTKADHSYTVNYIKCYVEPLEETLEAGDTTQSQGIYIKCPWMTPERLEAVWTAIDGFTYRPVSNLRFIGDPRLEPGDVLQVTDRDGTTYAVPCMTLRHEFDGGLISEISAVGKSKSASEKDYQGPVTRMIERANQVIMTSLIRYQNRIEAKVEDIEGNASEFTMELDKITNRVSGLEGNYSQLFIELDEISSWVEDVEGNYSSIEQLVKSIKLEVTNGESSSSIKLTADGMEAQSQTIQFTGDIIFKSNLTDGTTEISGDNIKTGHISADRIEGGTLVLGGKENGNGVVQVVDERGQEIGTWNNEGIRLLRGEIQGPTVKVGGSSNKYGTLDVLDASDVVRMRASNNTLRFFAADTTNVGAIVCDGVRSGSYTHSLTIGLTDFNAYMNFGDNGQIDIYAKNGVLMDFSALQLRGNSGYGLYIYAASQSSSGMPAALVESSGGLYLDSGNNYKLVRSSSSSLRYKDIGKEMTETDIEALYQITPVWAKYKDGYLDEHDERCGIEHPMFIAEDIEKYAPLAVDHNLEGQAENWNYRVMIPYMFQMIKAQREQIRRLELLQKR